MPVQQDSTSQQDSATLLGAALARKFHEHNYTSRYLARRCRTEVEVVDAWRAGVTVPNLRDWWYLLRVHRSFDLLTSLWKAAAGEVGLPVEDPDFVGDRRQRETSTPCPASSSALVERITQTTRAIEVRASEEVDLAGTPNPTPLAGSPDPTLPAPQEQPVGSSSPSLPPAPTRKQMTTQVAGADASQVIRVPEGFVVYRCRISRGRILEIPLPLDLSGLDVERLCAFLRTQVDDEGL